MKYVNDSKPLPQKQMKTLLFDKLGTETSNQKERNFAKVVVDGDSESYYIRTYQNMPYDPLGAYSRREIYADTKMHKVSKNTFDFYIMYLKSNNSIYMTKAQRGFIND
jgi:hypothetical protein